MTDEHDADRMFEQADSDAWADAETDAGTESDAALSEDVLEDAPAEDFAVHADIDPDMEREAVADAADVLLSAEVFDEELARLEAQGGMMVPYGPERVTDDDEASEPEAFGDEERIRGPRAQAFRRRLRTQISVLPLALYLLALGGLLLAQERNVDGLPDLTRLALVELGVLAGATSAVLHVLLAGRRERGLLFVGLWVWFTAGMLAVLVYGIDEQPDATKWWPVLFWSLGLTLLVTFLIERTHDPRLVLLSMVVLVAGSVAYAVTADYVSEQVVDSAADYWPLLLSVLGVVLLPLVFRRRVG